MRILPDPGFFLLGGWLLLASYFGMLALTAYSYPPDTRRKLFYRPRRELTPRQRAVARIIRLSAICFVALTAFSRLQVEAGSFAVGMAVYGLGWLTVLVSLLNFRSVAASDVILEVGLYRYSRNPQVVGLITVYLGAALAVGSWLLVGVLAVLAVSYQQNILTEEKFCLEKYGAAYQDYCKRVPRYLLFG
jgi:protein-S-isoprenylcysteine O-methyltransferase Ste14